MDGGEDKEEWGLRIVFLRTLVYNVHGGMCHEGISVDSGNIIQMERLRAPRQPVCDGGAHSRRGAVREVMGHSRGREKAYRSEEKQPGTSSE